MLASKTVQELLDAFSAPTPTPGGGSAAALAGAVSASLLAMVAAMPKTKNGTPEERATRDRDPHARVAGRPGEILGGKDLVDPGRQPDLQVIGQLDREPGRRAAHPGSVLGELRRATAARPERLEDPIA